MLSLIAPFHAMFCRYSLEDCPFQNKKNEEWMVECGREKVGGQWTGRRGGSDNCGLDVKLKQKCSYKVYSTIWAIIFLSSKSLK